MSPQVVRASACAVLLHLPNTAQRIIAAPSNRCYHAGMNGRSAIFDWVRLAGAVAVVFGHSYTLTSNPLPLGISWHSVGVASFFAVSGYLITGSWRSDPHLFRYAEKRARRIMPALLVVVVMTVFVIGPVITTASDYWRDPVTWKYFWRNSLLLPFHSLPGVFQGNPSTAVNGSLWTLPVEVFCYLMTPVLVRIGPVACVAAAAALLTFPITGEVAGFGLAGASGAIPWFLLGAAMKLAGLKAPQIGLPTITADLSYGMYLTAFPVQQIVIANWPLVSPGALTLGTLVIIAPLAWMSWTFVERPMIGRRYGMAQSTAPLAAEKVVATESGWSKSHLKR